MRGHWRIRKYAHNYRRPAFQTMGASLRAAGQHATLQHRVSPLNSNRANTRPRQKKIIQNNSMITIDANKTIERNDSSVNYHRGDSKLP